MSFIPEVRYIFVEGSIGAGKSTLLDQVGPRLRDLLRLDGLGDLVTVPEPIAQWTNVAGHNLLEAFYTDKTRYAALFQSHALVTRIQAVNEAVAAWTLRVKDGAIPHADVLYVLCERSIFTDRLVFVEALHQDGHLTVLERAVYEQWWDFWQQRLYPGTISAVIHLRATPKRCLQQIRHRARCEETGIPEAYLDRLDKLHVHAFNTPETWRGARRLTLNLETLGNLTKDTEAVGRCSTTIYDFVVHDK